jgi:hypothetical protein
LEGDEHVAQIVSQSRAWVNLKSARRALGELLEPYVTERPIKFVRLASKDGNKAE